MKIGCAICWHLTERYGLGIGHHDIGLALGSIICLIFGPTGYIVSINRLSGVKTRNLSKEWSCNWS
jgi:hypothetical protein